MGSTVTDGAKQVLVILVLSAVFAMALYVLNISMNFQRQADKQFHKEQIIDHTSDFTAMAVYGKAVPMANVVAALDMYGMPEVLCLQMEDLKNEYGGTPYPVALGNTDLMNTLTEKMRGYLGKKVYVYTATPNGELQLCVSELPHTATNDGGTQNWERP